MFLPASAHRGSPPRAKTGSSNKKTRSKSPQASVFGFRPCASRYETVSDVTGSTYSPRVSPGIARVRARFSSELLGGGFRDVQHGLTPAARSLEEGLTPTLLVNAFRYEFLASILSFAGVASAMPATVRIITISRAWRCLAPSMRKDTVSRCLRRRMPSRHCRKPSSRRDDIPTSRSQGPSS